MLYMKPETNRGFVAVLLALAVGILLFMTYAPTPDNGGQDTNDVSQAIWTFPEDPDIEMVTTYTIEENKQTWEITFPTIAHYRGQSGVGSFLTGSLIGYVPDDTLMLESRAWYWEAGDEEPTRAYNCITFDEETNGYIVNVAGGPYGSLPASIVKIVWTLTANPIEEPEE